MMKSRVLFLVTLAAFALSSVVRAEESKEVELEVRGMT
jgi:hypothetical protein